MTRDGGRPWSDQETRTLRTYWQWWYATGVPLKVIKNRLAKRFGRTVNSVASMGARMNMPTLKLRVKS